MRKRNCKKTKRFWDNRRLTESKNVVQNDKHGTGGSFLIYLFHDVHSLFGHKFN